MLRPRIWVRITADGRTCWYIKRYRRGPIRPIEAERAERMLEEGEAVYAFTDRGFGKSDWKPREP